MTIAAYLTAIMIAWSPPAEAVARTHIPEARETAEERTARYVEIAQAIDDVVSADGAPLLFSGRDGRANTAVTMLAVSWLESGWRRDVDLGLGKLARGGGRDSCLMQLRVSAADHERLTKDRRACFGEGLALMRRSYGACRSEPSEDRLAVYASGSCRSEPGKKKSRERIAVARRMLARFPVPKTEEKDGS